MLSPSVNDYLRHHIRTVPNWPAPGVAFRDITPLLQNPKVFRVLIDAFVHRYMDNHMRPDVQAVAQAHGATVALDASPRLGGLRVTLVLQGGAQ